MSILIFCDGACSGNPGPGGWGAIVADDEHVRELGGGHRATTNNQMELTAAIEALRVIHSIGGEVQIVTDSVYVIKGITEWIWGWKKRGWVTATGGAVANRELWEALLAAVSARGKSGKVEWKFVKGHSGSPGNDRVDAIAVAYSKNQPVTLYDGARANYAVSLELTTRALPERKKPGAQSSSKSSAYCYLSLLDGVAMRHLTWGECEARVKGKNAKFKKVNSEDEAQSVLKSWGVPD